MYFTLEELLEQKALLERHLAWLERKIVAVKAGDEPPETGRAPKASGKDTADIRVPAPLASGGDDTFAPFEYTHLYGGDGPTSLRDAKKGCLIWIVAAALISVLAAVGLYVLYPEWDEAKARARLPAKTEDRGK